MKTFPIGPFLGLNNRLPLFALHVDKVGDFLSVAENVDIDNAGRVRRRRSMKLIHALAGVHSLYKKSATTGYYVVANVLYAFTVAGAVVTQGAALKTLTSNAALTYVAFGDDLFFSNGTDSGRITAGAWHPMALATPTLALGTALSIIGGGLLAGWYQVGISYGDNATGEESGISASENIHLTTTGGIRVTLPTAPTGATHTNIYLSSANGEVPMWLAQVPAGATTYDCTTLAAGRESNGRFESPLPAGRLFMSNGRLCSITGNRVYVGSPWKIGYYVPVNEDGTSAGYIDFPAPVSVAIEAQTGTYIVAAKTHWFPGGDLANVEAMVRDVLPYGAVPGTEFAVPDKPIVGWFGPMGVVLADTMGQVTTPMNDNVDVTVPASGNSIILQTEGYMRVVSCGYCMNLENNRASTYTGWDFTSDSGDLGTKEDGIYQIAEGLVDSVIGLGKLDFGTEELKHLPAFYLGVDSEEPMNITVGSIDQRTKQYVEYSYDTRSCGSGMQIQRADPGKGLCANWFDITIRNTGGAEFKLSVASPAPINSKRKI